MTLPRDIARCWDADCPLRTSCERWLHNTTSNYGMHTSPRAPGSDTCRAFRSIFDDDEPNSTRRATGNERTRDHE